jgi:hypothetical protein
VRAYITEYLKQRERDRLPRLRFRLRHAEDNKTRELIISEMQSIERNFAVRKSGGKS